MCTFVFVLFVSFFGDLHRHVNEVPYVDVGIYTTHLSYHTKTEHKLYDLVHDVTTIIQQSHLDR